MSRAWIEREREREREAEYHIKCGETERPVVRKDNLLFAFFS